MRNIKASYLFNVESIAGKVDNFLINLDYDGNPILLIENNLSGKCLNEVYHFVNGKINKFTTPFISETFDFVQPLNGNWLLVNARIDEEEGYTENATLYNINGNVLNTFSLDDAIQDVQTTMNGDIWVSYFDENMDSGLCCFNSNGNKIFDYKELVRKTGRKIPFILDCYALNVTSDSTYVYYYTDFPLVKISEKGYEIFSKIPVKGSHAFAIFNGFVLFSHDYNIKAEVYLYSLKNKKMERLRTLNENGELLNYSYAVGRGSKLLFIKETDVFLLDLENLLIE